MLCTTNQLNLRVCWSANVCHYRNNMQYEKVPLGWTELMCSTFQFKVKHCSALSEFDILGANSKQHPKSPRSYIMHWNFL